MSHKPVKPADRWVGHVVVGLLVGALVGKAKGLPGFVVGAIVGGVAHEVIDAPAAQLIADLS